MFENWDALTVVACNIPFVNISSLAEIYPNELVVNAFAENPALALIPLALIWEPILILSTKFRIVNRKNYQGKHEIIEVVI